MLDNISASIDSIRQPEYTGENRCSTCTVVNLTMSVIVSGLVALVSPVLAMGLFVFFVSVIYLRGYLVPGTPALTMRYLPSRAKQYFQTHETSLDRDITAITDSGELNIEQFLRDAGVLTECNDADDLCLTDEFRNEWRDAADCLESDEKIRTAVANLLGVEAPKINLETETHIVGSHEETVVIADNIEVARWESRGAMLVDLAASEILIDHHPAWASLDAELAGDVLLRLRVFLEKCPFCGGRVTMEETTYDGCCGPEYTVEATCIDCGELLIRPPEQML